MTRVSSKWAEFWATANSEASRGTCKIFQVPNVTRQFFERSVATTIEVLRSPRPDLNPNSPQNSAITIGG